MDQHYSLSNRLANSIVVKSKAFSTQEPRNNPIKKPLPLSVLKLPNSFPASKPPIRRLEKRRRDTTTKRRFGRNLALQLPISMRLIPPGMQYNGGDRKDATKAICYNCNKMRYFGRNYFETQKNRGTSKTWYWSLPPLFQLQTIVERLSFRRFRALIFGIIPPKKQKR